MRLRFAILLFAAGCNEYEYSELRMHETFFQPDVELSSDVLFVIDDSASMSEEQAQLGANFAAFVAAVQDTQADWQLGVVTTDVEASEAGLLRGGVLGPDTPDLEMAFLAASSVGVRGSRDEQGLAAAVRAVSLPANEGFVRPGARLNVVVFSDEDDHSPHELEVYLDALGGAAGEGLAIHGVVGDLPYGCASGASAADPGERYVAAVAATGGYQHSICADDYSEILTRVGLDVAGLQDRFTLGRIPDPSTLEVYVDGVRMHARDVDGWRYDPGDNAIVFSGRAVPRPGMSVLVDYMLLHGAQGDTP